MLKADRRFQKVLIFLVLIAVTGAKCHIGDELVAKWLSLQTLLKDCPPMSWKNGITRQELLDSVTNCMQKKTFVAIDALLSEDVIPLVKGIDFIRYEIGRKNATKTYKNTYKIINSEGRQNSNSTDESQNASIARNWRDKLLVRFARIFRTHVMKIDIDQMMSSNNPSNDNFEFDENSRGYGVQGRGRRRRRKHGHMMSMVMMGVLLMGTVLIPMGFQFLAVLGGKALILAKMALMLSSIQGLKKIATSGVNYGLYHSHDPWHERSGLTDDLHQLDINPYQHLPYTLPRP